MATLYVTEQGARLEKEYRRLLVTRDNKVLMAVPLARVSEVVLIGSDFRAGGVGGGDGHCRVKADEHRRMAQTRGDARQKPVEASNGAH